MEMVLDLLNMEQPDRAHKIRSIYTSDTTPSLHVYKDNYHCYATGQGGDVIRFVMDSQHVTFGEALKILSRRAPVSGRRHPEATTTRTAGDLTARFRDEQLGGSKSKAEATSFVESKWPYLTLADLYEAGVKLVAGALWVPHKTPQGRITGIKVRNFKGAKFAVKGSTFTTNLYRPYDRPDASIAVLVEGESDTWCVTKWLRQSVWDEIVQAVGLPTGAGTWRAEWVDELRAYDDVVVCLDGDAAGAAASERIMKELAAAGVDGHMLRPPGGRVAEAIDTADDWLDPVLQAFVYTPQ